MLDEAEAKAAALVAEAEVTARRIARERTPSARRRDRRARRAARRAASPTSRRSRRSSRLPRPDPAARSRPSSPISRGAIDSAAGAARDDRPSVEPAARERRAAGIVVALGGRRARDPRHRPRRRSKPADRARTVARDRRRDAPSPRKHRRQRPSPAPDRAHGSRRAPPPAPAAQSTNASAPDAPWEAPSRCTESRAAARESRGDAPEPASRSAADVADGKRSRSTPRCSTTTRSSRRCATPCTTTRRSGPGRRRRVPERRRSSTTPTRSSLPRRRSAAAASRSARPFESTDGDGLAVDVDVGRRPGVSTGALDVELDGEHLAGDPVAVRVRGRVRDRPVGAELARVIRSVISKPSALRRSLSGRTSSRAVPSARRSSSSVGSSATASAPSWASASSSCCSARTSTSSGSSVDRARRRRRACRCPSARTRAGPRRRRPSASSCLHRGHELAEARAERAEVRHDGVVEQALEVGDDLELLHVELVGDLGGDRRRENVAAGHEHERRAERLAHAELGVAAGRVPERHDVRAPRVISASSVVVDRGDVSAAGQSVRCTDSSRPREVRVHLVGDERAERREQLRDRRAGLVQRRVRGGVGRLPEPRAATGARTSSRGRRRARRAPARRAARRSPRARR